MKVLFLDMDGVLNNVPYALAHRYGGFWTPLTAANAHFDPANVAVLKRVVDSTLCKIVISSTWRRSHKLSEFQDLFLELGFAGDLIIGMTPVRDNEGYGEMYAHNERGREIEQYLRDNPHIETMAIVDDVPQFLPEQRPYLVLTDDTYGLTPIDGDKLVEILGIV